LGTVVTAFGTAIATTQVSQFIGVLLGLVGVVLLLLIASLLGWGIVVLLAKSTYVYNPRISPAADSVYRAEPVGVASFFTFASLGSLLGSAGSAVATQAASALSFLAQNFLLIVFVVVLFAFYFVWDGWHHRVIEAFAEFEVNFFLGFWRSLAVPLSAVVAFIADMFFVALDGVRHFVQAATVITIEKSLICGFTTLQVVGLQAFATFNQSIVATEQWLRINGDEGPLTRGPDYFETGILLGRTINSTQTLLACACEPLATRLFQPLLLPFTEEAFARAFNDTLGITPGFVTQVIFRPVATSITQSQAEGAVTNVTVTAPSFNATFDEISFAVTNFTRFVDSFVPALQNTTTQFIEDLLGIPLPETPFPKSGVLTAFVGGPIDIISQTAKVVFNLISNAIFNSDQVFSAKGFLFWRFDDAFEAFRRAVLVLEGIVAFVSEYLREIGNILAANVRKRSDLVLVQALRHLPQSAVGDALKSGFDIVADLVDTFGCFVDSLLIQFGIRAGELIVDWPVGTIYQSITTAIDYGFPNIFAFSQELWGDNATALMTCVGGVNFNVSDGGIGGVGGLLFSANLSGCLAQSRFIRYCNGVNDAQFLNATLPPGLVPGFFVDTFRENCPASSSPNTSIINCTTTSEPLTPVLGVNVWNDTLQAIDTTANCTTNFFNNLCTGCSIFGVFLGEPLVDVVVETALVPLNILIHINLVVTTEYLGTCVDFNTPLNAVENFFVALSASISDFNLALTGTPCPVQTLNTTTVDVDSAVFLCAFAGTVQFSTATVVEFVRQGTIAFETVIVGVSTLAGVTGSEDFLNIIGQIDFTATLSNAEVAILDATGLVLSIFIPAEFKCADNPAINVRTAFVNALGLVTADAILLIPNVVLNGTQVIIKGLAANSSGGALGQVVNIVGAVFAAVLLPILKLLGDIFTQAGAVFNCLTKGTGIGSVFTAIGDFLLSDTLAKAITLVVQIFVDLLAFLFGILQVLVEFKFTLLEEAASLFGTLAGDLYLLIFGAELGCEIQSDICSIIASSASFVVDQCGQAGFPVNSCNSANQSSQLSCLGDSFACADIFQIAVGKGCPSSPFGCCSLIQGFPAEGSFPVINIDLLSPCQTGQFCDQRSTCIWNLPRDPSTNVATIPFTAHPPPGNPDAALGQSVRTFLGQDCPRFSNLTNCADPGPVDSSGTPITASNFERARPFGFRFAVNAPHVAGQAAQLLNEEYCMGVVEQYGRANAAARFEPLRRLNNRLLTAAMKDFEAQVQADPGVLDLARCYYGLYPEAASAPPIQLLVTQHLTRTPFAASIGRSASSSSSSTLFSRFADGLGAVHRQARVVYERNKQHARVVTPASRHAAAELRRASYRGFGRQVAADLRRSRNSLAHTLANANLAHSAEQRVQERKLTGMMFSSFAEWVRERRIEQQRARSSQAPDEGLMVHIAALGMHMSDALEHGGYLLNYHLNLRPSNVDTFGMPVRTLAESIDPQTHFRPAAIVGARQQIADGDDYYGSDQLMPHPLKVLGLWVSERRAYAGEQLLDKIRSFTTSANYVAPSAAASDWRWWDVIYRRQTGPRRYSSAANSVRQRPTTALASTRPELRSRQFNTLSVYPNDTTLEEILGVVPCNTSVQSFCTNCGILDNIVFAVEQQINVTVDFYTSEDPTIGFPAILNQFETTVHNTLIDPVGPDTWTTAVPRTPFILRRFLHIDWPWKWNYTEFRTLVYGSNFTSDTAAQQAAVGTSFRNQSAIAASQNRTDLNLAAYNATSMFIAPVVDFLEQLVFAFTSFGPINTIVAISERYIVCDYAGGIMGFPPQATGLFDALIIVTLGLFVIGVFISVIPGAGMCFMVMYTMIAGLVFFPLVFWIGYGAQPLCTIPSFFGGIPGIPVPFGTDLQRLFEELTPECPPVNPGMIDPAAFEQFSTVLCGEPGPVPPLIPCSQAAGFIDGLDNVFFMMTGLYGQNVTFTVAAELDPIAPSIAEVARIYTDAHVNALAARFEVGALCNFITIGNVVTLILQLGVLILAAIAVIALIVLLIGLLLITIVLGLYACMIIWLQVRKGFLAHLRRYGSKMKTQ